MGRRKMLRCNIEEQPRLYQSPNDLSVPSLRDGQSRPASHAILDFRVCEISSRSQPNALNSDRDLGSNLDHAPGRDMKEIGGIARGFCQTDEQTGLPARHAGM